MSRLKILALISGVGLAALFTGSPIPVAAAEPPATDLPTVDSVLDRFVAAVGGREAVSALAVRRYRGVIDQDLSWTDPQHQETPFVADADSAGAVRFAESDDWSALAGDDVESQRDKIRWLLHPHNVLRVEEFFPHLTVSGRETRAGRPVVVLAPRDLNFSYFALYFDEETGLLNHIGYHNDLTDWRPGGGVLFPHCWDFGRKGGHTSYLFAEVAIGRADGAGE